MDLMECDWWQFDTVKTFSNRFQNAYTVEGIFCWEIDGREDWLLFSDGQGLFEIDAKGLPIYHDITSPIFLEMVAYIHREDWVDWVLDEMDALWETTLIDEFNIDEDYNTPEICDAAYEWLPHVLPDTYAKVFPNETLIRKLAIAFFIDQTNPQTINFDK